ncbi:hypothetical protein CONLIGDRAFT_636080 [Coniochaeta ligniaria NRRL 30616]|uniref:HD domain-containing protein n=1 Tax=Coniochaeta ligniaria NRRL 30616 TaxID=1408157 RepID=A0A1J7ICD3_9PEZI|nr:hypothetical protein CONLIGDRAFT_636080 [Coniochaeta ligniaria NRRL 30616]
MDKYLELTGALKGIPRQGWVQRDVPVPESVAGHMYQMAMMCITYPWDNESDRARAVEMALVYDAPEAIAGDVTPSDGVSKDDKRQREELALDFLACLLRKDGYYKFADRVKGLW